MRSGRGIHGTDHLSDEALAAELEAGGRFVVFQYCVSFFILTQHGSSKSIFFVRKGEIAAFKGLGYTFGTLLAGWWGFPWGLIYTPLALARNLRGGTDVTGHVVANVLRWHEAQAVSQYFDQEIHQPDPKASPTKPVHSEAGADVPDVLKDLRL